MSVANAIIRKQILNQRFVRSLAKKYQRDLQSLFNRVADRIAREPNNVRLQAIQNDLQRMLNVGLNEISERINADIVDFAGSESEFLEQVMRLNSTAILKAPDIGVIIRALKVGELAVPVGPSAITMAQALSQFSRGQTRAIRRILTDGVLLGETIPEMTKAIRLLAKNRSRHQVEALTRTLTNFASSQAKKSFAIQNKNVFDGEEWSAVLDSRTTLLCSGRDGNVYPIGKGPFPPAHWNCRSVRIPVLKKDFEAITQKSNRQDFDSWLKRQDKEFQREYFSQFPDGEEKLDLFRKGGLELQRFRDETGVDYTLDELKALYPNAIREAGIEF